jgi:VWFA-related protein
VTSRPFSTDLSSALAALIAVVALSTAPSAQQQPTFRSGVDLVAVDVSVIDKNGRPADDLTAADFTLKVDGKSRKLSSAEFINLRRADDSPDLDRTLYTSNHGAAPGRLILIVLDEGNIHKGGGRAMMAAASQFIDGLNKSDRISLEFVPGSGPIVGFTANHALVKQLLANGVGRMVEADTSRRVGIAEMFEIIRDGRSARVWAELTDRECRNIRYDPNAAISQLEQCKMALTTEARILYQDLRTQTTNSLLALRGIIQRLAGSTATKTIVLITEGIVIDRNLADISWIGPLTSEARVNLFALQLAAVPVDASMSRFSPTRQADRDLFTDGLDRLTGEARGTVFPVAVNANAAFSRLDLELSGYYLLSFEPDLVDRDGKPHKIDVQVTRPGLTVRARPAFSVAAASATKSTDELMVDALKNPLPLTEVPLKLTTFTYRDDESPKKLKILVSTEIDRSFNPAGDFSLGYLVTDPAGKLVSSQFEKALAVPSKADEGRPQRFTGAIVVDPGVYNIKLAVIDPKGRAGSVERTFEAKLSSAGQLRMGDLMLAEVVGRAARPSVDGRINAETLMAYAEVYSDAEPQLQGATVRIEIGKTEGDRALESSDLRFTDRKFVGKRAAEGAVPIATLPAGDYVARAVFSVDGNRVGSISRPFTVTHADAALKPAASTAMPPTADRVTFVSKIDSFERQAVLSPAVVSFFVDRMNIVGLPAMPVSLAPAIAAAKAGRFAELQQSLDAANSTHPAAAFLGGIAKLSANDPTAAQAKFREALRGSSDFSPATFYLGACYAAAGRDAEAIAAWQTALITEPGAPFVYTLLGDAMLRLRRTGDAIGLLREAALLWPDADEVLMRFATALAQGGQPADAMKILDPYVTKHPEDQDRLMLGMRLIYEAKAANKPIDTVGNDRARFNRYFAAYEKTGGPQLAVAAEWKKIVDR